jgi:hypothetical protein
MQRLMTWMGVFALTFAMILNIVLLMQNTQLHRQLAATPQQQQPTQALPAPPADSADLKQQLERAEKDRIKAAREATTLRDQLNSLQSAGQERDQLKQQVQTLTQQNQQLQSQVGNLQTMNTINGQVVKLRGLTPMRTIKREFMNHDQLRAYFTDALAQQYTPEAEQRQRAILKALDMDDGTADLRKAQVDDAVKSILGFYDHTTKQLVIVSDHATMSVRDRVTYAHEYTHSLQDQHYNLLKLFARAAGNSDYEEAIRALVEGDATVSMGFYARANLTAMDIATYQLEQVQNFDLSGILSPGGGPLVESAAAFPYTDGANFVYGIYQHGGWPAVTRAFANPPRSTEQVLHPEAFLSGNEPVRIGLPDLGARLGGGWDVVAEDTLGELYMRIYLERAVSIDLAIPAGIGWGGDRYQVLHDKQGRLALALHTAWDSPNDAQEFFETYSAFVVTRGGGNPTVLQADEAHMRWQLADRQFYLSRVGNQVLVLHAPDGATLDALIRQFQGF